MEKVSISKKNSTPKKGRWFQKIPRNILFSPGGIILFLLAIIMELLDIFPAPFVDQIWELPLEIVFMILMAIIVKLPLMNYLIPFLIERIPVLSDILPTWVIRMLM